MTRDLLFAYLCWLPPQGLCGAHLLYLRRPWLALLYSCTLGCFLIGWLTDGLLLPSLVASTAASLPSPLFSPLPLPPAAAPSSSRKDMSTLLALYCALGVLGAHRLYCGEGWVALLYLLSFGLLGMGTISDAFQLAYLLDRAQHPQAYERYSLFTAYQLLLPPFGLLGLHQFYIGRRDRGWWYAATVGLLGLGVVRDVFTLPTQVREANEAYIAHQVQAEEGTTSSDDGPRSSLSFPLPALASYRRARAALSAVMNGSPRCVACMQAPINTVFLDCGHSVFCIDCARTFVEFAMKNDGGGGTAATAASSAAGTRGGAAAAAAASRASASSAPSLLSASAVSLPCPICRHEIREIKQIYVSS